MYLLNKGILPTYFSVMKEVPMKVWPKCANIYEHNINCNNVYVLTSKLSTYTLLQGILWTT